MPQIDGQTEMIIHVQHRAFWCAILIEFLQRHMFETSDTNLVIKARRFGQSFGFSLLDFGLILRFILIGKLFFHQKVFCDVRVCQMSSRVSTSRAKILYWKLKTLHTFSRLIANHLSPLVFHDITLNTVLVNRFTCSVSWVTAAQSRYGTLATK